MFGVLTRIDFDGSLREAKYDAADQHSRIDDNRLNAGQLQRPAVRVPEIAEVRRELNEETQAGGCTRAAQQQDIAAGADRLSSRAEIKLSRLEAHALVLDGKHALGVLLGQMRIGSRLEQLFAQTKAVAGCVQLARRERRHGDCARFNLLADSCCGKDHFETAIAGSPCLSS